MPFLSSVQWSEAPPWLKEAYERLEATSRAQLNAPYEGYVGERLAPLHPYMQKAHALGERTNLYEPSLAEAQGMLREANTRFPAAVNEYMNPYQQQVVRNIAEEGGRTFREKIMPQLEASFVGLGQHGGRRHQAMAERAGRDIQAEILKRQQEALSQGYQQAGQLFNADKARQLESAREIGGIGALRQAGNLSDIAMLGEQGRYLQQQEQARRDLAYQDFLRQREHPKEQAQFYASSLHGIPYQGATTAAQQTPGAPQVNILGQLGSLAGNIYGARLAARRHGGHIKKKKVNQKRISFSDIKRIR